MHFLQVASLLFVYHTLSSHMVVVVVLAEFSSIATVLDRPDDEQLVLEPIAGTHDFLNNITLDISDKPWDDARKESRITSRSLRATAKCERIQNITCFGTKIAWKFTSIQLSNEESQEQSLRKLTQLEATRYVPRCWAVIQPFLCAVYMPKCTRSNDRDYVYLPSYEMCRVTYEPCRILYESDFFPRNLKCNRQVFPCQNCTNAVREMKFNATGQCMLPLVPTESNSINHYPDIEGCGLQCKNPMYTDDEHQSMHSLIFWGTIFCLLCNLFVIATFLIHDWKHSKHPAWNLFYISICFLFNWTGWMLQFLPGHREQIVCRRDGTLRHSEPSAGENLACIVPFILIYYFLIAANVWFAIFTYAWYLQTKDRGSIRDRIDKESFYFHFIAWALPFILTVSIMVLSEVDGNSIIGICFVGYRNRAIRNGLVMTPVAILSFGVSVCFAFKGCLNLNRIKRATTNADESKKLRAHILGTGIRTMLVVCFIAAFFIFDSYEMRNADRWKNSLNEFIVCNIKESYSIDGGKCRLQNRPSVAVLQLRLLCLFGVNVIISSWCWTSPALETWTRFIKKKMGYEYQNDEDQFTKKPKHRIIADAYAKRMDEMISISMDQSRIIDPAGLNFDMNHLNSITSDAMGVTLTNYLSNIIHRRNAMTTQSRIDFNDPNYMAATATTVSHQQHSSTGGGGGGGENNNSEISVSVRHFSVESRRNSMDSQVSQVSVKMSEIKARLESRKQKNRQKNMIVKAKKRSRQHQRGSNRSNLSNKFKYGGNDDNHDDDSLGDSNINEMNSTNLMVHPPALLPIERFSARTTADINDLNQLLHKNHTDGHLLTSDDDDDDNDDSEMHRPNEQIPIDYGISTNSVANSVNEMDVKSASVDQMVRTFLQTNTGNHIEMFNPSMSGLNDHGHKNKFDGNGMANGKSQKYMQMPAPQPAIDVQRSFPNGFADRVKFNHLIQNGSSCDVGIQANDYEIVRYNSNGRQINGGYIQQSMMIDNDTAMTETHQLLPNRKHELPPLIIRKENLSGKHLSESEKMEQLKRLLLPSN